MKSTAPTCSNSKFDIQRHLETCIAEKLSQLGEKRVKMKESKCGAFGMGFPGGASLNLRHRFGSAADRVPTRKRPLAGARAWRFPRSRRRSSGSRPSFRGRRGGWRGMKGKEVVNYPTQRKRGVGNGKGSAQDMLTACGCTLSDAHHIRPGKGFLNPLPPHPCTHRVLEYGALAEVNGGNQVRREVDFHVTSVGALLNRQRKKKKGEMLSFFGNLKIQGKSRSPGKGFLNPLPSHLCTKKRGMFSFFGYLKNKGGIMVWIIGSQSDRAGWVCLATMFQTSSTTALPMGQRNRKMELCEDRKDPGKKNAHKKNKSGKEKVSFMSVCGIKKDNAGADVGVFHVCPDAHERTTAQNNEPSLHSSGIHQIKLLVKIFIIRCRGTRNTNFRTDIGF